VFLLVFLKSYLQTDSCLFVILFALSLVLVLQARIAAAGGILVVIAAARAHPGSVDVSLMACVALANLADNDVANMVRDCQAWL
jgi:hypothetical protein